MVAVVVAVEVEVADFKAAAVVEEIEVRTIQKIQEKYPIA
jgi:hypothetical protein